MNNVSAPSPGQGWAPPLPKRVSPCGRPLVSHRRTTGPQRPRRSQYPWLSACCASNRSAGYEAAGKGSGSRSASSPGEIDLARPDEESFERHLPLPGGSRRLCNGIQNQQSGRHVGRGSGIAQVPSDRGQVPHLQRTDALRRSAQDGKSFPQQGMGRELRYKSERTDRQTVRSIHLYPCEIRDSLNIDEGFRAGPLFASSLESGRSLLPRFEPPLPIPKETASFLHRFSVHNRQTGSSLTLFLPRPFKNPDSLPEESFLLLNGLHDLFNRHRQFLNSDPNRIVDRIHDSWRPRDWWPLRRPLSLQKVPSAQRYPRPFSQWMAYRERSKSCNHENSH